MKMNILILSILSSFMVGCGGGGSDELSDGVSNQPTRANDPVPDTFFNNPIAKQVQAFDVKNVVSDLQGLSKSNFVSTYKKVHALQFSAFPDLNTTFDINTTSTLSSKVVNKNQKVIYKDHVSLIEEHECEIDGTVRKDVKITGRGHLDANTYKDGDNTEYSYNACDRGTVEYNGRVTYHVNDFSQFDYTFGAVPLGTFDSKFNSMSTETETQKVTLNGTIRYTATAQYKPKPDGSLISLIQTYATVGDFIVTVYDKSTGETIKLTYNGTLEKKIYTHGDVTSGDATSVERSAVGFTYRKTSDYLLRIDTGEKSTTTNINDNQSGVLGSNGQIEMRPVGYDYANASAMTTPLHTIRQMTLADGTLRYILDLDTDFFSDADIKEGEPTHTLPPSDIDLMGDMVVIGFDTCPPTTLLRQYLDELGVDYTYVNIHATDKERAAFDWFNVRGVPYVGIKGNFIGAAGYDKKWLSVILNVHGFDMNETLVKETRFTTAAEHYQKYFDKLQTGFEVGKHTAMAVANDTPHSSIWYGGWKWNTTDEAKEFVLTKCEEDRKKRVENKKTPIKSKCRLYSVDGVKEPEFR